MKIIYDLVSYKYNLTIWENNLQCRAKKRSTMTIHLKRKQQGNIWMYMQSNLKKSQNQAEKLKKLSDVKRKVNFRSSQVEAFRNGKLSDQFLIILNTKIFVLNRKSGQPYIYPLNCCWNEFLEKKKTLVILEYALKMNRSSN